MRFRLGDLVRFEDQIGKIIGPYGINELTTHLHIEFDGRLEFINKDKLEWVANER